MNGASISVPTNQREPYLVAEAAGHVTGVRASWTFLSQPHPTKSNDAINSSRI